MFEQAAGLAALSAISPLALLVSAILLVSARPGRTVIFYVIGGTAIVTIIGVVALVALRAGGLSHPSQHQTRYGLRLGLGVVALLAAVIVARRKPKPTDAAKQNKPSMITRLTARPAARTAFAAGLLVFGPSVSFIAAVQVVAAAKASLAATIGAMAMIVVLDVSFGWLPLIAYLISPDRTVSGLKAVNEWLGRNGKLVLSVALGLIGVLLVAQGIGGLE